MNKIILPPDVEFHNDIRLLVYRPRGLVDKAVVNKIISVVGELETTLKEPFNRFSDTVAAEAVDLNVDRAFVGAAVSGQSLAGDGTAALFGKEAQQFAIRLQERWSLAAQQARLRLADETGEQGSQGEHDQHLHALDGKIAS